MRSVLVVLCALAFTGCRWSEARYFDAYAEADCTFLMDCLDPAVLNFLGWETLDDCIQDKGTQAVTEAEGCEYNPRAARPCVKGIEEMTCPPDGEEPDYPPICETVFDCAGDTGDSGD